MLQAQPGQPVPLAPAEPAAAPEVDPDAEAVQALHNELDIDALASPATGAGGMYVIEAAAAVAAAGARVLARRPPSAPRLLCAPPPPAPHQCTAAPALPAVLGRREEIVGAVRARLEALLVCNGPTQVLQRAALPGVVAALAQVPPAMAAPAGAAPNKFRSAVLALLGRLPAAEVPKPQLLDLMAACQGVLNDDHEDHGIVAQRLLFDIHKVHKQVLEDASAPFFEWLKAMYEGLPASAERQLVAASAGVPRPLLPARESLRMAPDIALMIFFLMQSYPKRLAQHGPTLLPLMLGVISVRGPDRADVPASAAGVYSDFRLAQIKTMAFIIVVSRSTQMQPLLAQHRDVVAAALLRVMQAVPDSLSMRKEVLSLMRNMLNTPFRLGLQANMDALLDERLLLGTNRVCIEALRQMAYMNLAELVAASKTDLTLDQLRRVVRLYSRNAADAANPPSLQATSMRLLYNIIEVLFARRGVDPATSEAYRDLLSRVLDCMVAKLGALRDLAPRYICELKELEEGRRQRKVAEAAAAADAAGAAKRVLGTRRAQLAVEAKAFKAQTEAAAAEAAAAAAAAAAEAAQPQEMQEGEAGAAAPEGVVPADAAPAAVAPAEGADAALPAAAAAPVAAAPQVAAAPAPPAGDDKAPEAVDAMDADVPAEEEAVAEEEGEEAGAGAPDPFRILLHSTVGTSSRERDVMEYRNLLTSVLNCLKNTLFTMVAFHTSRGMQGPVRDGRSRKKDGPLQPSGLGRDRARCALSACRLLTRRPRPPASAPRRCRSP
jgi:transformation/transcription domain-associated protein